MLKYILKRLLLIIPTLLGVLFIVFAIMNFTPGDPGRQILGISAKQETVDELNYQLGYDRPFLVRFVSYIGDLLQGDLGTSYRTRQPFTGEFFTKVPVTLKLGCLSFIVSSIVGISLGILSAVRQYSFADTFSTITAILFASIPGFFLGMVLIYVFGLKLGLLPTYGLASWKNYIMPVIALALYPSSYIARLMRSSMLDVMGQDYMRTARAKGLSQVISIFKHALRNAILPVVTYLGPLLAYTVTGSFIVEKIFTIPGLGSEFIGSITGRDYPLIMGTTIFLASLMVVMNVIVDVAYKFIDPRINLK